MGWRCPDPHRAKVICIVQEISGAIRRQVLLLSCFHQPVHIPVQLGCVEMIHYLTLHSTLAGLRGQATAACSTSPFHNPRHGTPAQEAHRWQRSRLSASDDDLKRMKGCAYWGSAAWLGQMVCHLQYHPHGRDQASGRGHACEMSRPRRRASA